MNKVNNWKEVFKEILQPDLRFIFGKTIKYSECKMDIKITSPFGVFKEGNEKEIIEKNLKREKFVLFLILRELGIIQPTLKIKEIEITKRKSIFGVILETKIENIKQSERFLNIMMEELFQEKKRGKITRIGKNTFEIEDLNFFSQRKYLRKPYEPAKMKNIKIKIKYKEDASRVFSPLFFLNFIGLK